MRLVTRLVVPGVLLLAGPRILRAQEQQTDPGASIRRSVLHLMPDSMRLRLLDSLTAGRARWSARGPRHYRMETQMGCFCRVVARERMPRWPVVEVRDGRIVGARPAKPSEVPTLLVTGLVATVEDLFASAERELRDSLRTVSTLEIDGKYGFPRRIHADTPGMSDVWRRIEVRSFTPLR